LLDSSTPSSSAKHAKACKSSILHKH
jgi:hypothetical protein